MKVPNPALKTVGLFFLLITTLGSVYAQSTQPNTAPTPLPKPQPTLVGAPEIIIDRSTGEGSTLIYLRNAANADLKVSLSGVVTGATKLTPKIFFKAETDQGKGLQEYPLTIRSNEVIRIMATVTDATSDGNFEADISNNDVSFGKVKIIHFPFAVALDGTTTDKAELSMVGGLSTSITLKNDDPVPYPLVWRLAINGREVCGDRVTLSANGIGLLQCQPSVPFGFSRIQDLFKVESTDGHALLLYRQTPTGELDRAAPWKIIPVKASLSYFAPSTQQLWGYIAILVVLILGGLTSLFLSQALPNRLKRLNIKDRLMGTARTTANLSSYVGSRLQVMLRVERSRIYDVLESRNTFSPDFPAVATRCSDETAKLEARVALVQQIDVVLGRLDQILPLNPVPSRISEIEAFIDDAKVLLAKTQPTDKDIEDAQTAISEAAKRVDTLNQPDALFAKQLAKRVLEVKADIDTNIAARPVFIRITNLLPGPNDALKRVPASITEIAADQYSELDMAVEKILLMKDYVLLVDGTADRTRLDRLQMKEDKLLKLLQLESWPAVRCARLLLREMKDDIYPERLEEVLLARAATIDMNPTVAYDKAPLEFCVSFRNDTVNEAVARQEWTCEWVFGDSMKERGWTASHYFLMPKTGRFKKAAPAEYKVQATFRNGNGDPLIDPDTKQPLALEQIVRVQPSRQERFFGDRSRTELLKLVAALLIAVFALVAGAREQLLKLDILPGLIAVFLVGFGADTIKNLLTKTESTT